MLFLQVICFINLSISNLSPFRYMKSLSHDKFLVLGSLIKLVYFSRHEEQSLDDKRRRSIKKRFGISNGSRRSYPILGGRLHFVKFETGKLNECLDFISSKQLHLGGMCDNFLFNILGKA